MGSGESKQSQESEDQRPEVGGYKLIGLDWAEHLGLRFSGNHTLALTRSSLAAGFTFSLSDLFLSINKKVTHVLCGLRRQAQASSHWNTHGKKTVLERMKDSALANFLYPYLGNTKNSGAGQLPE